LKTKILNDVTDLYTFVF